MRTLFILIIIFLLIGTLATFDSRKIPEVEEAIKLLSPRVMAFAERSWHEAPWESTFTASTPYQPPQRLPNQQLQPPTNLHRGYPTNHLPHPPPMLPPPSTPT